MKRFAPMFLVFLLIFPVYSLENDTSVVFLVDLSGSMERNDPGKQVQEGIRQMISLLPQEYQVALVGYASDIALELPLTSPKAMSYVLEHEVLEYGGYSNAGQGLYTAVNMLEDVSGEKHIVLICDGEILLPSQEQTRQSELLYQEAVHLGQGQNLHILALGAWEEDSFLLTESHRLPGDLYSVEEHIQEVSMALLTESFALPITLAHTVEISTPIQAISWNNPWPQADILHLYFHSSQMVTGFSGNLPIQNSSPYSRGVTLVGEMPETIDFTLETQSGTTLSLYYWGEISLTPEIIFHYTDNLAEETRVAVGEILFYAQDGTLFLGEDVPSSVVVESRGESMECLLVNGRIFYEFSSLEPQELCFSLSSLPITVLVPPVWVELEPFPREMEEENTSSPWILCLVFGFLVLLFLVKQGNRQNTRKKSQTSVAMPKRKKEKSSKYPYVGQLFLEMSQGREDFPSACYSLFRVPQHRPISLGEILALCYDLCSVEGAEDIVFSPGKDKSLGLYHGSQGTLLYQHMILRKNQTHCLAVGAVVELRLTDGSELVIRYDLN